MNNKTNSDKRRKTAKRKSDAKKGIQKQSKSKAPTRKVGSKSISKSKKEKSSSSKLTKGEWNTVQGKRKTSRKKDEKMAEDDETTSSSYHSSSSSSSSSESESEEEDGSQDDSDQDSFFGDSDSEKEEDEDETKVLKKNSMGDDKHEASNLELSSQTIAQKEREKEIEAFLKKEKEDLKNNQETNDQKLVEPINNEKEEEEEESKSDPMKEQEEEEVQEEVKEKSFYELVLEERIERQKALKPKALWFSTIRRECKKALGRIDKDYRDVDATRNMYSSSNGNVSLDLYKSNASLWNGIVVNAVVEEPKPRSIPKQQPSSSSSSSSKNSISNLSQADQIQLRKYKNWPPFINDPTQTCKIPERVFTEWRMPSKSFEKFWKIVFISDCFQFHIFYIFYR